MNKIPRWLTAVFAVILLVLLGGGLWFYRAQERRLRYEAEENLQAISRLKIDQIVQWRTERLTDADEMLESYFTREVIARWILAPDPYGAKQILSWFQSLQRHYHFQDLLLVDAGGRPLLTLTGRTDPLHAETRHALESALRKRSSVICDLHIQHSGASPRIEVIAPLFSGNDKGAEPLGAIIQRIDAGQFLYPLIASWPTQSNSAETLIVRRDGDSALILNELRYRKNTALNLRIPLTSKEAPPVMAVLGKQGMVDGRDYRGVEVLAVLKAVPDSNWFMVSKVDKAEVLADWQYLSSIILALVLGLVTAMAATAGMAWQHYAKAHYRKLYESEAALGKSEERYAATVMSIGDGVIATDAQGRVELLNPIAEDLTGWPKEEARGKPMSEVFRIIDQGTRGQADNPVERVLREGVVVAPFNNTLLVARDGKEFPIARSGAPIRSKKGDITGAVLVFRDRSKEIALLNELRESEDKYRNLYDEAPVGYVELDSEGRIERVNRRMLELLGYAAEEMVGEPMWNFVDEREDAEKVIRAKLSGFEPPSQALERTFKRRNGQPIPVLIKDRVARNREGRITRIRSTIQDITERKKKEEQLKRAKEELELRVLERTAELERRNRELQDFVFIASHDLQEPLRKIQVLGGLLADRSGESLNECGRDYLSRIVKAANRMRNLIESLLAYSHVSRQERRVEETDLKDVVNEALSLLEVLIHDNGARVEVGPLPRIPVNPVQMAQVFQNLIANGLKFHREGQPPHIRIYARTVPGPYGEACEICVEDNGIGFDEEYLDKIFVPFQRLHDGSKYEGVGMGLAICRKIVERHRGTITARSTPGKGSTFIVKLPAQKYESELGSVHSLLPAHPTVSLKMVPPPE